MSSCRHQSVTRSREQCSVRVGEVGGGGAPGGGLHYLNCAFILSVRSYIGPFTVK